jgi:RNA polymerase sigma factor (sigma-70 family)
MATAQDSPVIRYIRRAVAAAPGPAPSDVPLLALFIDRQDEAAFAELVRRHGPMVLGVCRRVLGDVHAAEDCFQATFLTLARKASSLGTPQSLGPWLHAVALRTALKARAQAARRRHHEAQVAPPRDVQPAADVVWRDLRPVLDEAVDSLPERYRRPVVLCYLEGHTVAEAARRLGCPKGTVAARLARARERLRARLVRRGLTLGMAAGGAALAEGVAPAAVPVRLVVCAGKAAVLAAARKALPAEVVSARAAALAEGVAKVMLMKKVKIAATVFLMLALLGAGAALAGRTGKAEPAAAGAAEDEGIAWGKAVNGLQAGLGFRPGDQETYEIGGSVTFVVYLRNTGDREVRLSYAETLLAEWAPAIEGVVYLPSTGDREKGRPIVRRSLKPGERITLGHPWFRVRPADWRSEVLGPILCARPGKYRVRYAGLPLRLDGDRSELAVPATGQVTLDIRASAGEAKQAKVSELMKQFNELFGAGKYAEAEAMARRACEIIPGDPLLCTALELARTQRRAAEKQSKEEPKGRAGRQARKKSETGDSRKEARADANQPLMFVRTQSFQIPFRLDPARQHNIRRVLLYVSSNEGKSYRIVAVTSPEKSSSFPYRAPGDGTYWFVVATEDGEGVREPREVCKAPPSLTVSVDTVSPTVLMKAFARGTDKVDVDWEIRDDNLDLSTFRLEYRREKQLDWQTIPTKPVSAGRCLVKLPRDVRVEVRLRVKDRAGNEGEAVLKLEPVSRPDDKGEAK